MARQKKTEESSTSELVNAAISSIHSSCEEAVGLMMRQDISDADVERMKKTINSIVKQTVAQLQPVRRPSIGSLDVYIGSQDGQ